MTQAPIRLAVDVGGTFTDVVLERGPEQFTAKVLTTPAAPERGVLDGLALALQRAGAKPQDTSLVIHGTTLATNAIIERKGAVTALVTTEGFRDVLDIGYESRHDQYDLYIEKPQNLVPRERRLTVAGRMDVHGRELAPLDEAAVTALLPALDATGAESVAVGFMHSYANPDHEHRAGEIIARARPDLSITLSSDVCPEVREYERFTTAVANAYVQPLMAGYLGRLRDGLAAMGLDCPVLLMTSGGGLTTLETARQFPIRLVESGPAGGAILSSHIAAELGLDKVISFDMGGTTAKICLIADYEPDTAREFEVDRAARHRKGSGLPLRIPVIEMVEIGAGGGSIARLDAMQRITIGPDSAGADPGPACYGRGGEQPTITDANVTLGRINPARFAGGEVPLTPASAHDAITRAVGAPLSLDLPTAAYGIAEMVDETMANAARVHSVERGKVSSEHAMIAFGGAAPLHACRLAEKLRVRRVVVPADAGVGSAVGFLRAPIAYEVVRSRPAPLKDVDAALVNALLDEMREEATAVVQAGAGASPGTGEFEERTYAFMRYRGQGHEIMVQLTLAGRRFGEAERDALARAFDDQYERLYKRTLPNAEVEVLTWALSLATKVAAPDAPAAAPDAGAAAPTETVSAWDAQAAAMAEVPLYERSAMSSGQRVAGPAIIAEAATSTFVPAGFTAHISGRASGQGHIIIDRIEDYA